MGHVWLYFFIFPRSQQSFIMIEIYHKIWNVEGLILSTHFPTCIHFQLFFYHKKFRIWKLNSLYTCIDHPFYLRCVLLNILLIYTYVFYISSVIIHVKIYLYNQLNNVFDWNYILLIIWSTTYFMILLRLKSGFFKLLNYWSIVISMRMTQSFGHCIIRSSLMIVCCITI